MAQRQRRGVGRIGRLRQRGQTEPHLHHLLHLLLVGPAPAGDGIFHLVRRVLHHLASGDRRLGERQPARLADAHRRAHVDLEEHLLDRHRVGRELGDQRLELEPQRGEPLRQRIGRRRADHPERDRPDGAGAAAVDDGVAAAREAGVDAEHPERSVSREDGARSNTGSQDSSIVRRAMADQRVVDWRQGQGLDARSERTTASIDLDDGSNSNSSS